MNPAEMHRGFFAYHCITLAQQMRFSSNVNGYFLLADDSIFNIWQQIDYSRVHHVMGVTYSNCSDWWPGDNGILAARRAVQTAKDTVDPKVIETWQTFENGLRKYGYLLPNETVDSQMLSGLGRSVSDFFYIPSTKIDYYASLMTIFYKAGLFLELAVNRFLRSVNHQTSPNGNYSYLWLNRRNWSTLYSENLMMLHPIKPSQFRAPVYERFLYCEKVMQVWSDIMFRGSTNYTTKQDGDEDYLNG
uniref:Uncharacterized protein n=1 Tax=Caenorhabditis japonica TaxID=281687 RepID=A0A8R1EPP7_CAEJA